MLAKLRRTTERTRQLAEEYARCRDLADGASLRRHMDFMRQLGWLSDRAERELVSAQSLADGSQVRLAAAERQRAAVEERAEKHARSLAKPAYEAALGARRRLGTELD
ncbi:MAG: hypothetical protein N2423_04250 [Novosphingobium sp.]|nr:hypothetical protein [Novosphingobium sp.]